MCKAHEAQNVETALLCTLSSQLHVHRDCQWYAPNAAVARGSKHWGQGTHLKRSIQRKAAGKPACRVRA